MSIYQYEVGLQGIFIGNRQYELDLGVLDTGNTCITLPKAIIQGIAD